MTSLTLAILVHLPFLATPTDDSYAEAHRQTVETGRPLVIMVGADWCPACKQMETTVIPQVRERGLLGRVAFALVNLDRDRELGQKLISGGPIPQLIMYRRTADGWNRRRLIGGQSVQTVEEFIKQDVANDDPGAKAPAEGQQKQDSASSSQPAKDHQVVAHTAKVRPVSTE